MTISYHKNRICLYKTLHFEPLRALAMMNRETQSMQHFAEGNIDFIIKGRCIAENNFYRIVHKMQQNVMSTDSTNVDFTLPSEQQMLHLALQNMGQS